MRSIHRETRLKMSYNPTGELFKVLTPIIKKKIAVRLRAFRAAAWPFMLLLTLSCTVEDPVPQACIGGDCDASMDFGVYKDSNGYYHVSLDWTREYYPYFTIKVEASRIDPYHHYNHVPYASAEFDSDTFWTIGEGLTFREPNYNPFTGNYSSSGTMLPTEITQVTINNFKGTKVNVVQNTEIYFREDKDGTFSTYRTVGPFPPELKNDTITLFMQVFWDAGSKSILKDNYFEKFIVE